MGACDSVKDINPNRIQNITQFSPIDETAQNYKFECHDKNLINNKSLNLEFSFFDIKIKHCISHNPSRNSTYATEIVIGKKLSKLYINQGRNPIINTNYEDIKIRDEFRTIDLENTYLSINIYEFTDDIDINILKEMHILPNEVKLKSKYHSFINIDLLSFLFKSKKCDFLMMGDNPLSSNTRISFICDIKHTEKIKIIAKSLNDLKICKLNYKTKDKKNNIGVSKNMLSNDFSLFTPLITMKELQQDDLFLETDEKETPYKYISLNELKYLTIRKFGQSILNRETDRIDYNSNPLMINANAKSNTNINAYNKQNNNSKQYYDGVYCHFSEQNNSEKNKNIFETKKDAYLSFENLPIVTQISSLYFTEYGHLYSTSLLNIINNDNDINQHRKSTKISSDDFYIRLKIIFDNLNKGNFAFNNLFDDLNDVLRRSIDNEKFYFLYPDLESLNQMIILMMVIGIKLIEYVQQINEQEKLNILLKTINNLMKREELDNGVLFHCLSNYNEKDNNLKTVYNNFFIKILKLNEYCRIKKIPDLNNSLIDLYAKLYFKKRYIREGIFNTLYNKEINYDHYQIDVFIYDKVNDEKLNEYLDQKAIKQILKKGYFLNLFSKGNIFLKNIILILNNMNINDFPFDFTLFTDNFNILNLLSQYIKNKKIEGLENEFLELSAYLSGSYISINTINNQIIKYTNGYNNVAIFKLIDYLNGLLEYYYSQNQYKLNMDYSFFEKAINVILKIDNSITIPKLFWLYYCCSDLIISGHLKYFITNICNIYFKHFIYHWSFTVRQDFLRLIFFIFNDKIKNEEGKLFNIKNINTFEKKNANEQLINREEVLKDYKLIEKEFKEWDAAFRNNDEKIKLIYPPLMLQNPNNPDNIDSY